MADEPLAIPLDEIQVDDKLHFIEEPVEIMDREVKRLKQSRIPIVKFLVRTIPPTIRTLHPFCDSTTTHIDTTILPTIPSSPDYTPASPDYSPTSDTEFDPSEDLSSDHIPPLPATLPFFSLIDDSSDSDIPNIPPSPTHGTPFTETTLSTQRSPTTFGALRRRVMVLAPGTPTPHGRTVTTTILKGRTQMNCMKMLEPLHTPSSCYSSSSSSLESSSDSSTDDLSDSASSHHLIILLLRAFLTRGVDPLLHLVPSSSPTLRALSYARADLLPSPKRIRSHETATDLEEIDECFAYADALRDRGIDARVVVKAIDREEIETGVRGPVEDRVDRVTHPVVADDIPEPAQEGAIEVTYETLGDLVQRFHDHTEEIPSADMLERIRELEQDTRRLRDIVGVESQRGVKQAKQIADSRSMRVHDAVRNLGPLMGDEGEQEVNGGNGNEGNRGN
ncbi:hypothetical protein Tco_0574281 [Tanacetum coccineum]